LYDVKTRTLLLQPSRPHFRISRLCKIFRYYSSIKSKMEQTASKANKTLSFVRRNLKVDSSSMKKKHAYQAQIRPKLEYCSSVWDPYTAVFVRRSLSVGQLRSFLWHYLCYGSDDRHIERLSFVLFQVGRGFNFYKMQLNGKRTGSWPFTPTNVTFSA
jgi:hypothetical protein